MATKCILSVTQRSELSGVPDVRTAGLQVAILIFFRPSEDGPAVSARPSTLGVRTAALSVDRDKLFALGRKERGKVGRGAPNWPGAGLARIVPKYLPPKVGTRLHPSK